MRLIVMLPAGKPPFIGILFAHERDGMITNDDLIDNYKEAVFRIIIDLTTFGGILYLICEEHLIFREYKYFAFQEKGKLKNWIAIVKHSEYKLFNFSHVLDNGGTYKIIKTSKTQKNFVLKVASVEIKNENALDIAKNILKIEK